jgi:hypothetical protein
MDINEYESLKYYDANCSEMRRCQACQKMTPKRDMLFTRDCHGIEFRCVCQSCYFKLMAKGYDGEYYTEADECIDIDY